MQHYTAHTIGADGIARQFHLQAASIEAPRDSARAFARDMLGATAEYTLTVWPRWS